MRYGSVEAMVDYLDRKEIAAEKERRMRKIVRRLSSRERRFALVLKRVLMVVPGPEDLHQEKIMEALKIKDRMYFYLRDSLHKKLL